MPVKTRILTEILGLVVAGSLSLGTLPMARAAVGPTWLTGVNLSGAELNPSKSRIYWEYTYPTKQEVTYFTQKGFKIFRIPVLSSRILSSSIADGGGGQDWTALTGLISQAAAAGAWVIIDIHQYGNMPSGLVGRNAAATTEFVAAWSEIANRLRSTSNVIFGLMNEPNQQSADEWLTGVNAAIAQIRKNGASQLILVPGSYWDGAHSWTSTDNAAVMAGVVDPGNNFAYEVHQYLDQHSSGTTPNVAPGSGKTSLAAFTQWARSHHAKGFLGEFGFASTATAMKEGEDLVAYMAANRDVWCGWTYWAGGPWWGEYMFTVEPTKTGDRPQMGILTKYK